MVEVCIGADDLQLMSADIIAAREGGASRIELCADMQQDGLTPSLESVARARDLLHDQLLLVMVRPRAGNFEFDEEEHQQCLSAIELLSGYGIDGVVTGSLTNDAEVNLYQLDEVLQLTTSLGVETTFHRAFDVLCDRDDVWQLLNEKGVNRVLTSGSSWSSDDTALQGVEQIKSMMLTPHSSEIVIGGGVKIRSAQQILTHLSPLQGAVSLHAYSGVRSAGKTDVEKVRALVNVCEQI